MRLCSNQGTQAFLKVIMGGKSVACNCEEGPARLCHNQVAHALEGKHGSKSFNYAITIKSSKIC
jgi:hypothetical protein